MTTATPPAPGPDPADPSKGTGITPVPVSFAPEATSPYVPPDTAPGAPSGGQGTLPEVPGYCVLDVIGWGGMGIVYKARHLALKRLVALKMVRSGTAAGPEELARFRTEAEAAARLQHPHIVQVYEVGEHQGLPFFSLEYVEGGSLAKKLGGTPLPPRAAAALVETLARAVEAAHRQHIIHRDLKPTNVLLTLDGQPKVADFGLAKNLDADVGQTRTGAVMGTPSYMAPEQAEGRAGQVGPAADVWALGAILYECLTGRPPFKGATLLETLEQVRRQEPVPPSRFDARLPRDLETICLACLQKDLQRRYPSAVALAEDLRRFGAGEPIVARPVRWPERLAKWVRRRPGVASLAAALALVAGVGLGLVLWQWQEAVTQKGIAEEKQSLAERAAENEKAARAGEQAERQRALEERRKAEERAARLLTAKGISFLEKGDELNALPWLVEALRLEDKDPAREEAQRVRLGLVLRRSPTLTGAWFHKHRRGDGVPIPLGAAFPVASYPVGYAELTPDSRFLITAGVGLPPDSPRVYDARTGALVRAGTGSAPGITQRTLAFSPDGRRVLRLEFPDHKGVVWDLEKGEERARLQEDPGNVQSASFSPAGDRILTLSRLDGNLLLNRAGAGAAPPGLPRPPVAPGAEARVWDAATGRPLTPPLRHPFVPLGPGFQAPPSGTANLAAAVFSPDGRRVATAGFDRTARVWDAETGKPVGKSLDHDNPVMHLAFSPDGRRLATAASYPRSTGSVRTDAARVWDVDTGTVVAGPLLHPGAILHLTLSPNGRVLATSGQAAPEGNPSITIGRTQGEGGETRLWDPVTGRPLAPPLAHGGAVRQAAFSPDGLLLVTACEDRTARVWSTRTGTPFYPPLQHGAGVNHAAFSPDGGLVVTAAADGLVRLWNMGGSEQGALELYPEAPPVLASFSPDGRRILLAGGTVAQVRDAASGKPLGPPLGHDHAKITRAVFSPDGRRIATAGADRTVRAWDADSGQPLGPPLAHSLAVQQVAFSPDGSRLVTVSGSGLSRMGNVHRAWGDDSRRMAFLDRAGPDGEATVWDVAAGKPLTPPLKHGGGVQQASFSPDGRWVLTVALDPAEERSEARVWDAATGQPVSPPLSPPVRRLPFRQQGGFIVEAAVRGEQVHVLLLDPGADTSEALAWEAATGQLVGQVSLKGGLGRQASFSRDGRRVLAVFADINSDADFARVWDTVTGQAAPPLKLEGPVQQAAFSPDGRWVLTAGRAAARGGEARLWEADSGKPIGPPLSLAGPVLHLAFSPDGRRVAAACQVRSQQSEVRIHDTTTGELLGPPLHHEELVEQLSFGADGRRLLVVTASEARVYDLAPDPRSLEELALLGQWLSSHRIDPVAGSVPLESDELESVLQELWSRYPSNLTAPGERLLAWHRRQADRSCATGQWAGAVPHLDYLLAAAPADGELYKRRARAHMELHEPAATIADAARAIELGAENWDSWYYRGAGHAQLGHWKKAAADLAKAAALNPRHWPSWYGLAHAQLKLGQYEEAIAGYTRAMEEKIESRQDALTVWTERGEAHARLGRWEKAAADFEKGIELGLFNSRALFNAAVARLGMGDLASYRRLCALQLEQFGRDTKPLVVNNMAYCCTLAEGAVADFERVVGLAEKGVAADPKNNDFLNTLGAALYRAGRLDAAAARLLEAIKVHPKDGEPGDWLFLALVRARQGQADEARRHLDKAVRLFDQAAQEKPPGDASEGNSLTWSDRLIFRILRREAEALLEGTKK